MSPLKRIQRAAYLVSRTAGDLDAARRGPDVLADRIARRNLTRRFFAALNSNGTNR